MHYRHCWRFPRPHRGCRSFYKNAEAQRWASAFSIFCRAAHPVHCHPPRPVVH